MSYRSFGTTIGSITGNFLLHIHERPEGRVVVTPVDFPRLSLDADTFETARATIASKIARELRRMSGSMRTALSAPVVAELDAIEMAIPGGRKGAKQPRITVSLVVTLTTTSRGDLYVVRAPEVPALNVAVTDRAEVALAAKDALNEAWEHWELPAILSCDVTGEVRLETVEIPFPPGDADSDGGDEFELEEAGEELTLRAAEGRLGRLDRRDALIERVLAALSSSGRSSVLLVGPPDVGKTALLHELALRLASGLVPPALGGRALWRLSANELIAGARFTGMWQDRARLLVARGRANRAIFAMGDPSGIIDAGRWSGSDNNMARYFRTYVESGELTLICECTPEVYAAAQKKEPSFIDAFHRIDVLEPTVEAAREILATASERLGQEHSVSIAADAVAAAVELTRRFEPYRGLPGKAVRLLEEATQAEGISAGSRVVTRQRVVESFATRTGLPLFLLSDEIPMSVDEARSFFDERVLGQPEAVGAVVDLVAVAKAGLSDPNKPLGSFFFVGPTGVGKTELTKALAEYLFGTRERVIRFDMGEFASADAAQRLVGTAWHRDGEGELTRRVREQPFCVVLLDEIEKAHRSVYDALLSALGEGRMTDANGRTADFRNAIIVMTSNLGAGRRANQGVGFAGESDAEADAERLRRHFTEEAERFFRPEFFNRIDRVIPFLALTEDTVNRIARRELGRLLLREGIARRHLLVEIDDHVVARLSTVGFHPQYGARPLQREIERAVIHPLARLIVRQEPRPGDLVRFRVDGEEVTADIQAVATPARPKPRARRAEVAQDASLSRAEKHAASLLGRVAAEADGELVGELREERTELVEQTNTPGFWDAPDRARSVLERLYQIEQALEHLDHLLQRADGLREMARQMKQNRHRARLGELRQALDEVEDETEVVRLELAGARAGSDQGPALIRIVPVDGAEEWAEALVAMYTRWAERTGRQAERVQEHRYALSVGGLSARDLLRNERGLHRHIHGENVFLARVIIEPAGSDGESTGRPEVVRVYSEGRQQFVRDPRSGIRVGDVGSVLRQGRIEEFLIGGVRLS
jgi:ATP-dependent Clp protease ATP-binding subunit ClpC